MPLKTRAIIDLQCPAEQLARSSWGNVQANLQFLQQTGLFAKPLRILEVGCHKGLLLRHLASQQHDVYGIDLKEALLGDCRDVARVCAAQGESIPFRDGSFDILASFDVFEHIPDSDAHLRENPMRPTSRLSATLHRQRVAGQ